MQSETETFVQATDSPVTNKDISDVAKDTTTQKSVESDNVTTKDDLESVTAQTSSVDQSGSTTVHISDDIETETESVKLISESTEVPIYSDSDNDLKYTTEKEYMTLGGVNIEVKINDVDKPDDTSSTTTEAPEKESSPQSDTTTLHDYVTEKVAESQTNAPHSIKEHENNLEMELEKTTTVQPVADKATTDSKNSEEDKNSDESSEEEREDGDHKTQKPMTDSDEEGQKPVLPTVDSAEDIQQTIIPDQDGEIKKKPSKPGKPAGGYDSGYPPQVPQGSGYPSYTDEDYNEEEEDPSQFGPGTCRYGGKLYVSAQQIPRDDPCDFCFCFRSDIICLQQSCPPPISGCHEEPISGFCCPRYECPVSMATVMNVTTSTTTTSTTLPPHFLGHAYKGAATKQGCQIKGTAYSVGEEVRASSGPCMRCV